MRAIRLTAASLLAALAITGAVVAAVAATGRPLADDLAIALVVAAYAVVGLAVELARPGHPVGRLMLGGSVAWGLGEGLLALAVTGLAREPDSATYALLGVVGSAGARARLAAAGPGPAAGLPRRPGAGPPVGVAGGGLRRRLHRWAR